MSGVSVFGFSFSPRLASAGAAPDSSKAVKPQTTTLAQAAQASQRPASPSKDAVFRQLFDAQWARVRHHLDCYIEDVSEVDELTAEVFVVAWRKLDPSRPLAPAWFLRTADNKLRDRTRSARSRDRAVEALTRGLQTPDSALDPMEVMALRAAVRSLNARERQVVVLTYWDGLHAGEIADVLRTTQGAVWTTLTRARDKLRRELNGGRS